MRMSLFPLFALSSCFQLPAALSPRLTRRAFARLRWIMVTSLSGVSAFAPCAPMFTGHLGA